MKLSRQSVLALCAVVSGTFVLGGLVMSPAVAGGAQVVPAGGCTATASVESQWGGGQVLSVTVANVSAATTRKWAVTWSLGTDRRVVSAWNAVVTTAGGTATAGNTSYNGSLASGASTTFGMLLSGSGSAPALSCDNGAGTPTSSAPAGQPDVTVGLADERKTVTLVVGQTLGVSLWADFLPPRVSGPALTQVSVDGGYPTRQPLNAVYRAAAPGRVEITTQTDMDCFHTTPPCALPARLWSVYVEVVAATGQTVTVSTADNRSTVRLHVGDTLVVSLPSNYLPPQLSTAGVLVQRDTDGGYPTGRPLVTRYVATAAGTVDVSTKTDIACNHEPTPCPSPPVPWTITATVTA